jgi:hypothetical protein
MLVDSGAIINLMMYSMLKKLGREDSGLVKTNLTLNGVGGGQPDGGVVSMEITVRSKSLATTFFVVEVHDIYSVILGRNWIHANRCVPSTLHQFFSRSTMRSRWCMRTHRLTLLWSMNQPTGSMGAPSACWVGISQNTTFLASPRKDLYLFLYNRLLNLSSVL